MAQRGRKSAAQMSVVQPVERAERAPAPPTLTEKQAAVWDAVVSSQPADWFGPENMPLLESYCAHVVEMRELNEQIAQFDSKWVWDDDGVKRYDQLLKMRERETKAVSHFARSMRLSQQSQYNAQAASSQSRKESSGKKPWES